MDGFSGFAWTTAGMNVGGGTGSAGGGAGGGVGRWRGPASPRGQASLGELLAGSPGRQTRIRIVPAGIPLTAPRAG